MGCTQAGQQPHRFTKSVDERIVVHNLFSCWFYENLLAIPKLPSPFVRAWSTTLARKSAEGVIPKQVLWLVLPFHPMVEKEFGKAVAKLNSDNFWVSVFCGAFEKRVQPVIRLSWKNTFPNQSMVLRKLSERYVSGMLGGRTG